MTVNEILHRFNALTALALKLFLSLFALALNVPNRLPEGNSSKQLSFFDTAGVVLILQGGERAADNLLGRIDYPLDCFPVSCCTAGEPHTQTASYYALYGAMVEGHEQSFWEGGCS